MFRDIAIDLSMYLINMFREFCTINCLLFLGDVCILSIEAYISLTSRLRWIGAIGYRPNSSRSVKKPIVPIVGHNRPQKVPIDTYRKQQ